MLNQKQGEVLVQLARQEIEHHLHMMVSTPVFATKLNDPVFFIQSGVFVSLYKRAALRGCVGSLRAIEPLLDAVRRHAVNAAFHDHRFQPVVSSEVPSLHIEVSLLSKPRRLNYTKGYELPSLLTPHQDGVILRSAAGSSATFLPQVWNKLPQPDLFLNHLCRKNGLEENAWLYDRLEVETYRVQYFEESPSKG
ncbi:MAG: AMMECR1 domain-containing protein [Desulfobulbus propionicus]|nr:MAG: AMMECR1 domain-containing protein [Desulfobulbus propionicus]